MIYSTDVFLAVKKNTGLRELETAVRTELQQGTHTRNMRCQYVSVCTTIRSKLLIVSEFWRDQKNPQQSPPARGRTVEHSFMLSK